MNHPVWLKVVCIGCIVLGALGLAASVTGIIGLLVAEQGQVWMEKLMGAVQQGMPPQMKEVQGQLMQESMDIQRQWRPFHLALAVTNLFVASGLLAGGIQALRMKPVGQKLLLAALAAASVFEVVRAVPTTLMQWQTTQLMGPYMERLMEASTAQGQNMPPAQRQSFQRMMRSTMVAGTLMGLAMTIAIATFKIAFYVAGIWLLRRPHIQAMYNRQFAPAEVVQ